MVFDSSVPLWQVPRNAYRQCLRSMDQLALHVQPRGRIGQYLYDAIVNLEVSIVRFLNLGETYGIGDSPLVLLTALQSSFQPNTSSSSYVNMPAPQINSDGSYTLRSSGRKVRVYTQLDVRLMFDDLFAKLALYFG